ncbi:molybdenum cofactor guanylyltransferase [Bacillus songklensis]|uniref:Probable molybdenum cofactor guanylyltransferase n=1 Tax=Bacillus songklensis TaxID=1069116 RepID=A0ABV8AW45_9BACI
MNMIGILLAGGISRRFGKPKAFAIYKDQFFYERAKKALEPNTNKMMIVSHPDLTERFEQNGETHLAEDIGPFQGKGPMAGIYTVMKQYEGEWYVVIPCDTPRMTASVIERMKRFINEDVDAVIPVINGRFQPLIAIYHQRVQPILEELLIDGDYRMKSLLDRCRVQWVTEKDLQIDGKEFENINDQSAFQSLTHKKRM